MFAESPDNTQAVFTGLVEEVGTLSGFSPTSGGGAQLKVDARLVLEGIALGDSIAVNGTCLTAIEWDDHAGWVLFDAVAETLRLTTLGSLALGSAVNLERALAVGSRMGGHFVTGHIDGPGTFISSERQGNGTVYRFQTDRKIATLIAGKGSITVDGISLTVVDVDDDSFTVWLVPHTLSATNLGRLAIGDKVNLETDILAKYVARLVCSSGHGGTVTMNKLQEAGFLS